MENTGSISIGNFLLLSFGIAGTITICVLAALDVVLKGIAMRKAGNNRHLYWFICLFIFNTCGILPVIYLLLHKKEK